MSYTDDGGDTAALPVFATDHVLIQDTAQTNAYGRNYYSSSKVSGLHSFTVTSSQLTSTGLNINIATGTHVTAVTVTCSAAVTAPTVSNVASTVAANSSNDTLPLSITGTATSVSVASAPGHGSATVSGTNILYTPAAGFSGTDSLTYTATNSGGTSAAATVSITVTAPPPAAPTAANVSATVAANSSNNTLPLSITGTATSVSVASAPGHGSATVSGTNILYTPAAGFSGTDSLTYTATNSGGTSAAATVSITVTAPPPAAPTAANVSATVAANSSNDTLPLSITGTATSVSVASAPGHGSATVSGTNILYTPAAGFSGTDSLTYTATNSGGTSAAATVSITVTAPPPAAPAAANVSATVAANSSNNTLPLSITGTATSVSVASAPGHGSATVSGTNILYTPAAGFSGTDSLTYTATNSGGTSSAATVSITVSAPVLTLSPGVGTTLPGGTLGVAYTTTIAAGNGQSPYTYAATGLPAGLVMGASGTISGTPNATGSFTVLVTATDANGASINAAYPLAVAQQAPIATAVAATVTANTRNNPIALALDGGTATSVVIATAPAHGTATATGTAIAYTPNAAYSGPDSFTYTAANASGSSTATVEVTVVPVPLVVLATGGTLAGGTVNAAYTQSVGATGGTSPYTYSATGLPAGLAIAASSGTISGTPTVSGTFNVTVSASDAAGATSSASYPLVIALPPPTAADVTATVAANSTDNAIALNVGAAAATVAIHNAARHGLATASGTTVTYTPSPGYSGADSFSYSVTNASGTASATVNLVVTAPVLTVTPATGATLGATLGVAYSQTITVSGGGAPYRFAASGLPAGLGLDAATGIISGTPSAIGTSNFTVTAVDAYGVQAGASYTLKVAGSAPVVKDQVVTLYAGQVATVNLSDGAAGGPFTGAALLDTPSRAQGTARLDTREGAQELTFAAAPEASGAISLRYTLTNAWGTSAPATVTLQVTTRPDPSRDPEVAGLLNAQVQSAEQFASAQIGNFNDRLERLHTEDARRHRTVDVRLGLPAPRLSRQGQAPAPIPGAMTAAQPAAQPAQGKHAVDDAAAERNAGRELPMADDPLVLWTGGFVNFGSTDRDAMHLSHTLVGLSAGADYRFGPGLVAGLGLGYGHELDDVGEAGTRNRGDAFSTALYGSYHPGPAYVDALLGYGFLDFASRRAVAQEGGFADGDRAGNQVFGSLSMGYDMRNEAALLAPYGRVQFSSTWLDGYREDGAGAFDLAYARQALTTTSAVAGMRGELGVPSPWGGFRLHGRVEYRHALTDPGTALLGYADSGNDAYSVPVFGLGRNDLSVGAGLDMLLPMGLTTGLTYQGMFGLGEHIRNHQFRFHVSSHF